MAALCLHGVVAVLLVVLSDVQILNLVGSFSGGDITVES